MPKSSDSGVKSAQRVIALIELLAENPQGLTFTEVGSKLGLPKSSSHQLLTTLVQTKVISYNEESKLYTLGVRLYELAMSYMNNLPFSQIAWPYLEELRDQYDQTIQMAILDGQDVVYVSKVNSSKPIQLASQVGSRLPAYATGIGKAVLACLSSKRIREIYSLEELQIFTSETIRTVTQLIDELDSIRNRGYARDLGEYTPQIRCVAVPVLGMNNLPVAAISVSMLGEVFSPEQERTLVNGLTDCARRLSQRLGCREPLYWQTKTIRNKLSQ